MILECLGNPTTVGGQTGNILENTGLSVRNYIMCGIFVCKQKCRCTAHTVDDQLLSKIKVNVLAINFFDLFN